MARFIRVTKQDRVYVLNSRYITEITRNHLTGVTMIEIDKQATPSGCVYEVTETPDQIFAMLKGDSHGTQETH